MSTTELAAAAGVTRGLLHHYAGTKRGLYLEVVRTMMSVSPIEDVHRPTGSARQRVDGVIEWLLTVVETHGRTWVAIAGTEGVGPDPEVQQILDEADALAALLRRSAPRCGLDVTVQGTSCRSASVSLSDR